MGESFATRGAFDGGKLETKTAEQARKGEAEALETAAKVRQLAVKHPAEDPSAAVKLEILYDGRVVPFDCEKEIGKAFVAEPHEGQNVVLRLQSRVPKDTLACVLKVNGENTLFRQKLPDLQCRKWLLLPENPLGIEVTGFQKDGKTRVLSKAESKDREIDYGSNVGTITLTVFRERRGKAPGGDLSDETQNTKVLEQAKLPEKKPDNFGALTAQLLADANRGGGGLIGEGKPAEGPIRILKFDPDPTPIMSMTVIYYKK
jgi:hypothetical protein